MGNPRPIDLLFVCLGNICRSPAAEAIGLSLKQETPWIGKVDSAGTAGYHIGEPPHRQMVKTGREKGFDLSALRARQVKKEDFDEFDYVIAMDDSNYADLSEIRTGRSRAKLVRLLDFTPGPLKNVPDPYYGGPEGFIQCFDIIYNGIQNFLKHVQKERESRNEHP